MKDLNTDSEIKRILIEETGLDKNRVINTINLLDEGGTVPFISRYRKEMTGSLDEVAITGIRDRLQQLRDLFKRRESIIKSIDDQGKLSPELRARIERASTMSALEDIYLPYKPKRKTRATIAKDKGLEPLAKSLFEQKGNDVRALANDFINTEKEVDDVDSALQGARDIIAEWVNENSQIRERLRKMFFTQSIIASRVIKGKEDEGEKFRDYFEWEEPLKKTPSHRILAMRRGEKEGILSLDIKPDDSEAINAVKDKVVKGQNESSLQVSMAAEDAYKRLLKPSMETEARLEYKKQADLEAIEVFAENLRQLLLSSPLGQKTVLALDPGFRTGCKLVVLDKQGKLLHNETIFPNEPQRRTSEASASLLSLIEKYDVEAIAIGNGTASRETEAFVRNLGLKDNVIIEIVSESGASIYSASEVARNEFPDHDLTVRGAVSIGRRLMDPLAELVKIDPKSIGVGQYQHDVDQTMLKNSLGDVVVSCVNSVGVELNTSSAELLSYVSGLGPQLAKSIVDYRNENGPFKNRKSLKKVPRLGDKAFEHSAGFLRVKDSINPLDASAVHPESYGLVEKMASDINASVEDLIQKEDLRKAVNLKEYISENVGLPTLKDIMKELEKPGRDPRKQFEKFSFEEHVNEIEDLKVGMQIPGIVTNVTNFGAFVDIGVHQDGLVHISQMADRFVDDPKKVVKVNEKVMVTVTEIDISRKRIGLSMKSDPFRKNELGPRARKTKKIDKKTGDMKTGIELLKQKFGKG